MKGKHCSKSRESGVSETVGYIIIFGIMMTGIGLVTLYGYPLLLQEQANANIRNMERNLIVLQTDVNSLSYKNVPYQETTLQVSGGVLSVENPDSNKKYFKIYNTSHQFIPDTNNEFSPGELRYLSDSQNIVLGLQNGAVVKWQDGGSTMLSEPRWFFDESTGTLVITLIRINSVRPLAQTGIGTIQMNVSPLYDIPLYENVGTVTIKYTDTEFDYVKGWQNYFNKFATTGTWQVDIPGVQKLVIKSYNITVLSL